jgi:hypothetical protein
MIKYLYCKRTKTDELITFIFPRFDNSISLSAAIILRSIIRQSIEPNDITKEIKR